AGLAAGAAIAALGSHLLDLDRGLRAGLFAGALTNTPALGVASDVLRGTPLESGPVLAYSITYPFGVLGALMLLRALASLHQGDLDAEVAAHQASASTEITTVSCEIRSPLAINQSIGQLAIQTRLGVVVSRVLRAGEEIVPTKYTVLEPSDVVRLAGTAPDAERAISTLGGRWHGH